MGSITEFFKEYGWLIIVLIIIASAIVFLFTGGFDASPLDSNGDLSSDIVLSGVVDANFTEEHKALAINQQSILNEIQKLNIFSQCVVDTDNIVTREIPIDEQGGFRRVSVVPLICPELIS